MWEGDVEEMGRGAERGREEGKGGRERMHHLSKSVANECIVTNLHCLKALTCVVMLVFTSRKLNVSYGVIWGVRPLGFG